MSTRTRTRLPDVIAGVGASAWAFFLLPPQLHVWSTSYGMPAWLRAINELPVYDGLRAAAAAVGWTDLYVVFGAPSALSFLLLALALRPVTRTLGLVGALLFWLLLLGAPITFISYVSHDWPEPWDALWGAEAFVLALAGLLALAGAIVALVRRVRPWWAVVLLGLMLVFEVAGTLLLGYWPHGTLVPMGVVAAVLALVWPAGRVR